MEVIFLGDFKDIIQGFPADVREDLGGDLRRLQEGQRPLDSSPMAPALPRVFELRADDKDFWYRVFYHAASFSANFPNHPSMSTLRKRKLSLIFDRGNG
jgi:phage-related protein